MYDDDTEADSLIGLTEIDSLLTQMKDILKQRVKTIDVKTYEDGLKVYIKLLLTLLYFSFLCKMNFENFFKAFIRVMDSETRILFGFILNIFIR